MDIDFVEYRRGRGIVAFLEVTGDMEDERHMVNSKKYIWERTEMQRNVMTTVSKALGAPAYLVLHTKDLTLFHVYDLSDPAEEHKRMTNDEYAEFIRSL